MSSALRLAYPLVAFALGIAPSCGGTPARAPVKPPSYSIEIGTAHTAPPMAMNRCVGALPHVPSDSPGSASSSTHPGFLANEVRRVATAILGEIDKCYKHALEKNPTLAGEVEIAWSIEGDGTVSDAAVTSTTLDDWCEVERCMLLVIEKQTFENPEHRGATATWKYGFTPP